MSVPTAVAANNTPLSPLRFLERSAAVFPERTAVVHGDRTYSLCTTRKGLAILAVGRPVFDHTEVRQAAERYRKRMDKADKQGYDKSNSRPAN